MKKGQIVIENGRLYKWNDIGSCFDCAFYGDGGITDMCRKYSGHCSEFLNENDGYHPIFEEIKVPNTTSENLLRTLLKR